MQRTVRSTILTLAALALSVGPVQALGNCAPYVSGWFNGSPAVGYIIGEKKVTVEAGFGYFFSGSVKEEFCVGTYMMFGRGGRTFSLQLRCDNYSIWGLF